MAQQALSGAKVGILAKECDVSPQSIRNWVKELQFAELEENYNQTLRALGEKEMENKMLRELVGR
ncbi:transposase [Paenibacillus zeirhizosphaerae]|uniref:transposase n=1 Tax=Paenibacillus zeirhizosphaerae TaxID=2987519 RepID=UPI003522BFB7